MLRCITLLAAGWLVSENQVGLIWNRHGQGPGGRPGHGPMQSFGVNSGAQFGPIK